jgi:hypothetical protein
LTPAGQADVDEHERVVIGEVDVAVVGGVVSAVPGQVDPLPTAALRARNERRFGADADDMVVLS